MYTRRRDAEFGLTVAHHLGGLVGAVAGRMHAHLSWFECESGTDPEEQVAQVSQVYPGFVSPSSGPAKTTRRHASPHHRPESAKELRPFDLAYYVVSPDGDTTTLLALLAISYQLL